METDKLNALRSLLQSLRADLSQQDLSSNVKIRYLGQTLSAFSVLLPVQEPSPRSRHLVRILSQIPGAIGAVDPTSPFPSMLLSQASKRISRRRKVMGC